MKKSSRSLFGIIAFAAVLAFSLTACGGGGGGGVKVVLPDVGDGLSAATAYEISHAGHLKAIANEVNNGNPDYINAYYKLTNNIDLKPFSKGAGWTPIGYIVEFKGNFDGGGFIISNLAIDNNALNYAGLFGFVRGGTIENLGVEISASGITGRNYVGGVAGVVNAGNITNCYVTGNVNGLRWVGGVVGGVNTGNITNCYATGNVEGGISDVGGVAGYVENSTMTNCYATGDIIATGDVFGRSNAGGVAGYVADGCNISNCYATGDISGGDYVGGVAGGIDRGFGVSSSVSNCYATGNVTSAGDYVGGVAGMVWGSTASNCYATGNVKGNNYVGGAAGQVGSTGSVSNCYATGKVEGNNQVGGAVGIVTNNSTVSNCAALNESIVDSSSSPPGSDFGRVAGQFETGVVLIGAALTDNFAFDGTISTVTFSGTELDGAAITKAQATTDQSHFDGTGGAPQLGWDFGGDDLNPWKWGGTSYPLPILYWQTTAPTLPAGHPLL